MMPREQPLQESERNGMSVLRHWLVTNVRGDLVAWVDRAPQADGIARAYPEMRVEGPFVLEAQQPPGAVEDARLLAEFAEKVRRGGWPGPSLAEVDAAIGRHLGGAR